MSHPITRNIAFLALLSGSQAFSQNSALRITEPVLARDHISRRTH